MTHQAKGDLLALDEVAAEGTFEYAVLPTVRRAWERTIQAVALESLVENSHPMPDLTARDTDDDEDG